MLILGSGSVARKELLNSVGLYPQRIEIPNVDESLLPNELPRDYVKRVAKKKADAIPSDNKYFLITADTIVTKGRRLLPKTSDDIKAKEYLRLLSGRRHSVYTAFCVKHNGQVKIT